MIAVWYLFTFILLTQQATNQSIGCICLYVYFYNLYKLMKL